jgi:hypothetical protein
MNAMELSRAVLEGEGVRRRRRVLHCAFMRTQREGRRCVSERGAGVVAEGSGHGGRRTTRGGRRT